MLAALASGYFFTWGGAALGACLLLAAGMDLNESVSLSTMLGFVVFLVVFCWAFACRSLARVWLILAGGGAAMTGFAALLSRALS